MSWSWTLIVKAMIGAIVGIITNKGNSMGRITNIITELIGSSIEQAVFDEWEPEAAGMASTPSTLGVVILVVVVSFFFGKRS